jgi:hypothetical protein
MVNRFPNAILFVASLSLLSSAANAQQSDIESRPGSLVTVHGAITPELIDTDQVYLHLSNILVRYGPSVCSDERKGTGPAGFQSDGAAPCMRLAGVEPFIAEQLGRDYIDAHKFVDAASRFQFCSTEMSSTIEIQELATVIDNIESAARTQKIDYFRNKGKEFLGQDALNILIAWADNNVRRGMLQVKADVGVVSASQGLDGEMLFKQLCSREIPRPQ